MTPFMPSVPSSSGKSLNSPLQKASNDSGSQGWFETGRYLRGQTGPEFVASLQSTSRNLPFYKHLWRLKRDRGFLDPLRRFKRRTS
jgi:hypothetical protein